MWIAAVSRSECISCIYRSTVKSQKDMQASIFLKTFPSKVSDLKLGTYYQKTTEGMCDNLENTYEQCIWIRLFLHQTIDLNEFTDQRWYQNQGPWD